VQLGTLCIVLALTVFQFNTKQAPATPTATFTVKVSYGSGSDQKQATCKLCYLPSLNFINIFTSDTVAAKTRLDAILWRFVSDNSIARDTLEGASFKDSDKNTLNCHAEVNANVTLILVPGARSGPVAFVFGVSHPFLGAAA
jgi:hypothetical protein